MNKTILLVEDNQQDEILILRNLKKVNLVNDIHIVRDGQQALDYIFSLNEYSSRNKLDLPIAILLDISLPRINGIEVLAKIRENPLTKLIPVIMLTSSDEESDRLKCYKNGCNSFVRKPVDFAEFAAVISNLGVYWLAVNIPPID